MKKTFWAGLVFSVVLIMSVLIGGTVFLVKSFSQPAEDPETKAASGSAADETGAKASTLELRCTHVIDDAVVLEWKADGTSGYKIERSDESGGQYTELGQTTQGTFTDTNTDPRQLYYYRVSPVSTDANSGHSEELEVYVRPRQPHSVIVGESFVEAINAYMREEVPDRVELVGKIGTNTDAMLYNDYFEYKGEPCTAIERTAFFNPDRVYLMVGCNEAALGDPKDTTANFKEMRKRLMEKNPNMEFVVVSLSPYGQTSTQNIPDLEKRREFNKEYKKFAKRYDNVYYCDAPEVLDDGTGYLKSEYDSGDGCHWNPEGAKMVVYEIRKWSINNLGAY